MENSIEAPLGSDSEEEAKIESDFNAALLRCDPTQMANLWNYGHVQDMLSNGDLDLVEAFRTHCERVAFHTCKDSGRPKPRKLDPNDELSVEADQILQERGFEVFNEFKLVVEFHRTGSQPRPQDVFGVTRSWDQEPPEHGRSVPESGWQSKRVSQPSARQAPQSPDSCERLYSSKSVKMLKKHSGRHSAELDKHPALADEFKGFLFGFKIDVVKKYLPQLVKMYDKDDDFRNEVAVSYIREEFKRIGRGRIFDAAYEEFVKGFAITCQVMDEGRDNDRHQAQNMNSIRVAQAQKGVETHGPRASLYDRRLVLLDQLCDLPVEVVGPLADLTSQDVVLFCDLIKSKASFDLVNRAVTANVHLKQGVERTTAVMDLLKDRRRGAAAGVSREEFSTVLTILGSNHLLGILTRLHSKGLNERNRKNLPRALSGKL
ncbi:hypothetical protein [Streptomyces sp. NBC_01264]|uniref:hypothetical protein n=1 Tax=Streptomyces sp. NBC_01264 TaxID=2903804 RepID=UPI002257B5D5|nr:hypothetical protein [Streptomyces sp. NBC_01264]MCX4781506.1 hypothetical protein [Streptomyces sp. NBC_01264]